MKNTLLVIIFIMFFMNITWAEAIVITNLNNPSNLKGKWDFSKDGVNDWSPKNVPFIEYDQNVKEVYLKKEIDISTTENEDMVLLLSRIDDEDEVFFNGKKIGETKMTWYDAHKFKSVYQIERTYAVPAREINFKGKNTIFIKILNNSGGYGIIDGDVGIVSKDFFMSEYINKYKTRSKNGDLLYFLLGAVFISMGIRYITEYLIVRDKKEDVFLSGISLTFGLFTFLRTSNREYLFNIDSYTFTKIEVINMIIILIFTISFIKAFFELKQSKIFKVMIITNLIFAFAVLFAYKISIVFNIYNIWNLILVSHLTICCYLFFVSRKDWEKKESWAIAIGFLVWIGAVGIDILYNFSILNLFNGYVSMYGFILFLIIIIIIKTGYYFTLKLEVKRLNRELSARVDEKTSELQNSKVELEIMNKKLLMMIEDLKSKEEQLIRSEKLAVIGEFAGSVTHEIKNPLGAILTNTQLLKLEIDEAVNENRNREKAEIEMPRLKEMLESSEIIEVAVKQAKNIITNLLDYTRMEKDDRKRIDLNHVVNSAVMLVRKEFINLRINMSVELGENLYFSGKSGEMTQVVLNLLLNARDALLERNNENKLIIVRTFPHDKKVVLEVEDNGIGMDEEHKGKVFEPFFTTKGEGKGTGLGMSVSYSILKKHNADVEIISEKNVGTKFIIKMDIFN